IYAPSLEIVAKINQEFEHRGKNLKADGRPILGLSSQELLQIILEIDERNFLIPAHIWTPWFAIFGSKSGYNSVKECFGDLSKHIFALETGLSSDPTMNWRVSALDNYALVSHSDAHSLPNLGREADIFEGQELSFDLIKQALQNGNPQARVKALLNNMPRTTLGSGHRPNLGGGLVGKNRNTGNQSLGQLSLVGTVEFFPAEGRYHFDGHRDCKIKMSPKESAKHKNICPKCGRVLTIGVLNRVEELSDRSVNHQPSGALPFTSLIELDKVIAESLGVKGRTNKAVAKEYWQLVSLGGSEMNVLMNLDYEKLASISQENVVEAIKRLRERKVEIEPGYDGEYGKVKLFFDKES
ncbi:MAG: endonuclease Q family protein, partial [Patescibacteria group bacterium]